MFQFCSSRRWTRFVVLIAVFCASASLGCGAKKATVSGTVSYKGEKLGNGNITFVGANEHASTAQIKADGSYEVSNVPVGTVKIQIETIPPPPENMSKNLMGMGAPKMEGSKQPDNGKYVKIPDKYKNAEKSGLTYEVKSGPQTHDINLSE
jgi:hypothetical protein